MRGFAGYAARSVQSQTHVSIGSLDVAWPSCDLPLSSKSDRETAAACKVVLPWESYIV